MDSFVRGRLISLAALAGAVWIGLAVIGQGPRSSYHAALAEKMRLEAQKVHLEEQIASLASDGGGHHLSTEMIWPGSDRGQVEADIQQHILEVSRQEGIELTSLGPAGEQGSIAIRNIGFVVEANTSWSALLGLLSDLDNIRPALAVSDMTLRSMPIGSGDAKSPTVSVRLVAWGFAPELGSGS